MTANPQAIHAQRQRNQERHTPAPGIQGGIVEHARQQRGNERAQQQAGSRSGRHHRGIYAALAGRSDLGQVRGRACILTGCRKTLHHAAQQQQKGRGEADGGIARKETDARGSQGHHHNGDR